MQYTLGPVSWYFRSHTDDQKMEDSGSVVNLAWDGWANNKETRANPLTEANRILSLCSFIIHYGIITKAAKTSLLKWFQVFHIIVAIIPSVTKQTKLHLQLNVIICTLGARDFSRFRFLSSLYSDCVGLRPHWKFRRTREKLLVPRVNYLWEKLKSKLRIFQHEVIVYYWTFSERDSVSLKKSRVHFSHHW